MADESDIIHSGIQEVDDDFRKEMMQRNFEDPLKVLEYVLQINAGWADFHLYVTLPHIDPISPPLLVKPAPLEGSDEHEYVYDIHDHGYKLSTSKGEEMYSAGRSMCRLFYTIEKMIAMLIERLQSSGIDEETEVQVAFHGHIQAQRKAFESVINLPYNVIVVNFEPGTWGENYLETVKRLADKGYGYPSEAPRDSYRQGREGAPTVRR